MKMLAVRASISRSSSSRHTHRLVAAAVAFVLLSSVRLELCPSNRRSKYRPYRSEPAQQQSEFDAMHNARRTLATSEFRRALLLLKPAALLAALFAFGAGGSLAQKMPEAPSGTSIASKLPEYDNASAASFDGPDRCRHCHKSESTELYKSPHAKLTFPGKDYIQDCEICHGPATRKTPRAA